jgi:hypothetical protein
MSHFYTAEKLPKFLPDVETPAQAVKHKKAWPSVTTVLSVIKDPFLDAIYVPSKLVEFARNKDFDSLTWRDLKDMTYGFRNHPWTNEPIPSSEFGTEVHKRIEDLLQGTADESASPWDDWATPFVEWVNENGVELMATEYVVGHPRLKIAGSIDFVGKDSDGKIFLADYKTRKCKGSGIFYPKDCEQLAVESWMLSRLLNLDYIPDCISVCICTETAEHYHLKWSEKAKLHYLESAKQLAKIYWTKRMVKQPKR